MSDVTPPSHQPQQPAPAAPYAQQPADQRFSVLAIVGFVLAFVVNIAGLVVSIIALVQVRKTGERGRGLALAGIIISALSLILGVVSIIILVAAAANAPSYSGTY
ncbi:DUF4190 domain-containing protein [Curtobacterium sp. 22159]|uniref:DUF4190 domain-containing protein n=1 Tax=Curtobacterium sp. 22159 TaxID=3453882 RepID=UPI003F85DDEA